MFTTLKGKSLKELKGTKKKIIVFGGEANGISQTILELNGENITIDKPKDVETESLNVAIATAIILSHV
jgi:tRNA G18 (ribose-2'-O)-methylase SpoU